MTVGILKMNAPTQQRRKDQQIIMSQTIQEKNKALLLDAFDTLFNKRDYVAAGKYWSPTISSTARTSLRAEKDSST
jgi:hypothetical protein